MTGPLSGLRIVELVGIGPGPTLALNWLTNRRFAVGRHKVQEYRARSTSATRCRGADTGKLYKKQLRARYWG